MVWRFVANCAAAGVATSAKHFPGLGRVTGNTDFTANVVDSVTTPTDPDLATYRSAAAAGVPFMMVALATYTKIDASRLAVFSPAVMRLLRSSTGFGGVIMSDDLGDAVAVANVPAGQRATSFLEAGGDMITSQSFPPAETMAAAVLSRTSSDSSFRATVDAAAKKRLAEVNQKLAALYTTFHQNVLAEDRKGKCGMHCVTEWVKDRRDVTIDARAVAPDVADRKRDVLGEGTVSVNADALRLGA